VEPVAVPVRREKANEAKRLRELEGENARLKKLLAEAELDKAMLKELAEGNF
jgi:cell shape-determining protein MreC